ncbi:MAG: hypothetical protein Tsb009_01760 [Planctomycetaceae bacterium]
MGLYSKWEFDSGKLFRPNIVNNEFMKPQQFQVERTRKSKPDTVKLVPIK